MEYNLKYTLKIATRQDDFSDLLMEAIEESPYRFFEVTKENIDQLISLFTSRPKERIVILLCFDGTPVGLIAGVINPNILRPDWKVATEAIWYITPEHRGRYSLRLLEAYEYWAREVGAKVINTANFGNGTLDRLYKAKGYKLVEHSFIKVLD